MYLIVIRVNGDEYHVPVALVETREELELFLKWQQASKAVNYGDEYTEVLVEE